MPAMHLQCIKVQFASIQSFVSWQGSWNPTVFPEPESSINTSWLRSIVRKWELLLASLSVQSNAWNLPRQSPISGFIHSEDFRYGKSIPRWISLWLEWMYLFDYKKNCENIRSVGLDNTVPDPGLHFKARIWSSIIQNPSKICLKKQFQYSVTQSIIML